MITHRFIIAAEYRAVYVFAVFLDLVITSHLFRVDFGADFNSYLYMFAYHHHAERDIVLSVIFRLQRVRFIFCRMINCDELYGEKTIFV